MEEVWGKGCMIGLMKREGSGGGGDELECHGMKSERGLEDGRVVANVGTCWSPSLILNEILLISVNPSACPVGSRV